MKSKIKFLIIVFLLLSKNSFSKTYEKELENLQNQIDKLNKKIEDQEKVNKNNFLEGIKISGRIHINGNWYNKDNELKSYHINDYNNKFSIRRARIGIKKEMNNFIFNFEGNFDKDRTYLGETYLGYQFNDKMVLKFGQVVTPAFMEREKSTNTMSTIELNSFTKMGWLPSYSIGLNYIWAEEKFGISTGIFGNGTNIENKLENDMNYNFSYRAFYTPIKNNNYILHLGVDFVYQDYKIDPLNNFNEINRTYLYGFELGFQYKYMTLMNEYIKKYYQYENTRFDGRTFDADGFSTTFTINFTGEHRLYSKAGYFSGINVEHPLSKGGIGAFQGVLRYSFANGKDTKEDFINNVGSHYDYTIGLTWIPENYIRLLINYSFNGVTKTNYDYKGKYRALQIELRMYF